MSAAPDISAQGAGQGAGLGLIACTALVVGNMIGSGIFLLPSSLAAYGSISLVGWLVTAAGALVLALIFGRLARIAPRTGGPYAYARDGFGDFAGFLVAWGYWIALWSGNAAIAVAFAGYLGFLRPEIGESPVASVTAALGAIWLLTWLNVRGVREAGIVQILTTGMKLFPLLALIVLGVAYIDPGNFTPVNTSEVGAMSAISACAALTLWAFLGLESATVPAGDVDAPERTIPLATIIGTALTALVYIGVTVVALGVIPSAELVGSNAPLALVAGAIWGAGGAVFIALGACVSTFGTLNGFTLLSGQVPLGAAQDGVFPKAFARLSAGGTPAFGLIVSNALASGLILMSFSENLAQQFEFIVLLATLSTLFPYLLCALAELALRARGAVGHAPGEMGKVIGLGALGFVYSIWAIFGSGAEVVFYGFLLLMAGVPVYVWQCWAKAGDFSEEGST
ncbi:amino acid permease [Tateyamaria omphalii]|uniref:amino acid permease n=1 Tax=Tateyamaria omphalii TaxID=299262 RepID=UPI001C98EFB7|nr:amino acid permease [Tateyamaria omphalii]MBY5935041.1 amino acid permease [Tateyamaria omphalii]